MEYVLFNPMKLDLPIYLGVIEGRKNVSSQFCYKNVLKLFTK